MRFLLILIIGSLFVSGCRKEEVQVLTSCNIKYRIAVILPLSGPDMSDWTNVTDWVLENIKETGCIADGEIELVWYDLYTRDVVSIANEVCADSSIIAAVGPFTSSESFKVAQLFIDAKKPLLLPTATSADISYAFSGKKYIWRLPESDISQCQALLVIAKSKGAQKVALITGDDQYGTTFYNWFGFLATEMDMDITAVESFDQSVESPEIYLEKIFSTSPDIIVAVPKNTTQAVAMVNYWKNRNTSSNMIFSDAAYMEGFINGLGSLTEGIEGTAFVSNPATGFDVAYQQKFKTNPTLGMSQIYDALMLLAFGIEISGGKPGSDLVSALMELSDGTGYPTSWDKEGINYALARLKSGERPVIGGASGSLKFAADCYTDIVSSTYLHWQINNQQFNNVSYYSSDGQGRVSELAAAWQSYASKTQLFDTATDIILPEKMDNWAMIVSTSQGWSNYRHQADAFRIYHYLKSNGFDDNHIVLCMADDIANNSRNPLRNQVIDASTGENLYKDFIIDYKIQDLSPQLLMDIMAGKSSVSLPNVIKSTENDNVFIYILGHGEEDGILVQGQSTSYLTPTIIKNTLTEMNLNKKYRQTLLIIESCYSGVFQDCEGIPSVLIVTAANRYESSKTVVYNADLDVWLSNQFTNEWLELINAYPDKSFSELYLDLSKTVYGSHVCVFNQGNFGNMNKNFIKEFVFR